MSEFKVGNKVQVTASNKILRDYSCNGSIKSGGKHFITEANDNGEFKLDGLLCGHVTAEMIEIASPKWSIYSNDLPWEKLSNKQKGKLLLAAHSGVKFENFMYHQPVFNSEIYAYTAIKPEPVKPEPTMEELFIRDWKLEESPEHMIAKGWTKPCK